MPLSSGPGSTVTPHGVFTDGPSMAMPIVRATISVVMLDTRQSPIEYHMRMFFTELPNSGSLMTCAAVVIGS
jgi:hypothetical protein